MLHTNAQQIKKAEAFNLIQKLYNGEELDHLEKSCLLLYFLPKVPKTPKNDLDFVRSGVANKNEFRYYLQSVCVRDGMAYASTGHYVRCSPCDLPDGLYDPTTMEFTGDNSGYPILKSIINTKKTEISNVTLEETILYRKEQMVRIAGEWYDMKYVKPVFEYLQNATISQGDGGQLFFEVDGIFRALILKACTD